MTTEPAPCHHPKFQNPPDAASRRVARKLLLAGSLATVFMLGEAAGGYVAGSLAVMTDAAHMLSDVCSFAIALTAHHMSRRTPTSRHSFGFHRAEILGALLSIMLIWGVTGVLVYEAVQRVIKPEKVDGKLMFIVACCGLGLNLLLGVVLGHPGHSHSHGGSGHGHGGHGGHNHGGHGGHGHGKESSHRGGGSVCGDGIDKTLLLGAEEGSIEFGNTWQGFSPMPPKSVNGPVSYGSIDSGREGPSPSVDYEKSSAHTASATLIPEDTAEQDNINMRAAMLHVIGDVIQSIGVVIAGALIWARPEWHIADPITTFIFSIIVLFTTWRMLKEAVSILMESTPRDIDYDDVVRVLRGIPGVTGVHDLHIWSITAGKTALSVHIESTKPESALALAQDAVWKEFKIFHSTIQIESHGLNNCCHPCPGGMQLAV